MRQWAFCEALNNNIQMISDELLQQRFRKELESDPAIRRAIIEDIYREWLRELTGRKTY